MISHAELQELQQTHMTPRLIELVSKAIGPQLMSQIRSSIYAAAGHPGSGGIGRTKSGTLGAAAIVGPKRNTFGARDAPVMAEGGDVSAGPTEAGESEQGPIPGTGSSNADNVTIHASPGEFLVPGDVVRFYGEPFFEDLIKNAEQKTGQPRGTDQNGRPPSPAAQASFAQHQEPDADDRGGAPDGDADDMGEQPEVSNPRPSVQGRPLRAAGPTMGGQQMAEGGAVAAPSGDQSFGGKPLSQHGDSELPHLARARRNTGDLAGHRAVLAEIQRRTNAPRMAKGGDVPGVSIPGGASPQVGRQQGGGRGIGSVPVGGGAAASRFNGGGSGGGGIRVPPVRMPSAPISGKPVINAPAAEKPIAMPNPPAVEGSGPPMAAAPAAAPIVQRSAAPRIGNLGAFAHPPGATAPAGSLKQPSSPLAMIGRGR